MNYKEAREKEKVAPAVTRLGLLVPVPTPARTFSTGARHAGDSYYKHKG